MANYIHVPPGSPEVPKLDVTVQDQEEQRCRDGALSLLRHLRPHWDPREVTLQLFTDGITNKLIACYVGDTMEDVVLVRIYGNKTELLVDRDEEVKSFRVLQAHGCAPQLYCTFNNGLCYEFIQGEALDPQHVCNPAIFRLIARQLAKIHAIHAHNGWIPKSNLWLKMGKYFSLIPTGFADENINKRFLSEVPSPQLLQEEMTWMKEILSSLGSPVVLCHNDLLCKNIIYNEKQGDVQFIDYEYSGYNYLAYDIGNHFNEFAGVSDVDYSLYPDRELQGQWLRSYLEAYKEYKGFGSDVTEKEVETLFIQVNQFALEQLCLGQGDPPVCPDVSIRASRTQAPLPTSDGSRPSRSSNFSHFKHKSPSLVSQNPHKKGKCGDVCFHSPSSEEAEAGEALGLCPV
ncbi:ethanolamine kinase 1 isoform X1 [Mus pahari]|uniref:ethanolamine kinase 1 isoform X1 n=1 Tax=Mus pahari TaxID=10093 RepID=UPI000A31336B|nr:ethanolamine kinase 1 isoform X1 [Mus pahari]